VDGNPQPVSSGAQASELTTQLTGFCEAQRSKIPVQRFVMRFYYDEQQELVPC